MLPSDWDLPLLSDVLFTFAVPEFPEGSGSPVSCEGIGAPLPKGECLEIAPSPQGVSAAVWVVSPNGEEVFVLTLGSKKDENVKHSRVFLPA